VQGLPRPAFSPLWSVCVLRAHAHATGQSVVASIVADVLREPRVDAVDGGALMVLAGASVVLAALTALTDAGGETSVPDQDVFSFLACAMAGVQK
jgi:hypothetical protein